MSQSVSIQLGPDQIQAMIESAKREVVQHIIAQHKDELDFISQAQAGGILDVSAKTLIDIPATKLPRYNVAPFGKAIRYRLSDVQRYAKSCQE